MELRLKRFGGLVARLRALRETLQDGSIHLPRDELIAVVRRRHRIFNRMRGQEVVLQMLERTVAHDHFVEYERHRVQVRAMIHTLAERSFRAEVARCAKHSTCLCRNRKRARPAVRARHHARETKIQHLQRDDAICTVRQKQILRFYVTMHEFERMRCRKPSERLVREVHRLEQGERTARSKLVLERAADEVLHDENGPAVAGLQEVDDLHDVLVVQAGQRVGLDTHALEQLRVPDQPPVEQFGNQLAASAFVNHDEDLAHAALGQSADEPIRRPCEHVVRQGRIRRVVGSAVIFRYERALGRHRPQLLEKFLPIGPWPRTRVELPRICGAIPVLSRPPMMAAVVPNDPLRGTRYRTLRQIGMGSMGEVFLVEHIDLERKFVAKILRLRHAETQEYVARLQREARTLGQICHPNVVWVADFDFAADGRPFIVMEYLEGRTIAEELKARGALPVAEAVRYTREVLSALGAAHAKGVVHRDIKPQNLFLHLRAASPTTIKVLDFGAARDTQGVALSARGAALATSTGTVIGTLGYLSPEGADGRRVDLRADIYAVGLVLAVMLSGQLPGRAPGQQRQHAGPDLDLPEGGRHLAPAILKALALHPDHRFQNSDEFLAALPA